MMVVRDCCIPATHPCLEGHFPGHPIVPGVVLLDMILRAVRDWQPERPTRNIAGVKFLRPVLPEQNFVIELEQVTPDCIKFTCRTDDRVLNTGSLNMHAGRTGA